MRAEQRKATNRALAMLAFCAVTIGVIRARAASQQIYDTQADARQDIAAAISRASKTGRNIVLVFGANWCPDCHALDAQMHRPDLARLIARDFVVVNIDVGRFDKNLDVGEKYGVPIRKGIPAIAVLDPRGKLLYSQNQGQFENARAMSYQDFVEFFSKWEPKR
ncbi:MAG TPA: thioredoxin family protein [Terriglobia bacterium]|nr:thioredoxin family protein [Terriglobia bacterium]